MQSLKKKKKKKKKKRAAILSFVFIFFFVINFWKLKLILFCNRVIYHNTKIILFPHPIRRLFTKCVYKSYIFNIHV